MLVNPVGSNYGQLVAFHYFFHERPRAAESTCPEIPKPVRLAPSIPLLDLSMTLEDRTCTTSAAELNAERTAQRS